MKDTRNNTTLVLSSPLRTDSILSGAETRIAAGYTAGLIAKEIATRCGVSQNTVVKHTQNIYDKTGIRRCTNALVAWFLSMNAGIDLQEIERRLGALLLLCLLTFQMVTDVSADRYVRRAAPRRTEARRGGGRREDDNNGNTLTILSI